MSDTKKARLSEETFKSDSDFDKVDESFRPSIRISKLEEDVASSNINKKKNNETKSGKNKNRG